MSFRPSPAKTSRQYLHVHQESTCRHDGRMLRKRNAGQIDVDVIKIDEFLSGPKLCSLLLDPKLLDDIRCASKHCTEPCMCKNRLGQVLPIYCKSSTSRPMALMNRLTLARRSVAMAGGRVLDKVTVSRTRSLTARTKRVCWS